MKLLLIDDDKMICFALKTIIEANEDMEVAAIGHTYEDAVQLYREFLPDVALFDIQIGEKTGIDALQTVKNEFPAAKVLFLTTFLHDEYIKSALASGSSGYILKEDFENITPAIRAVFAGQTVFGKEVLNNIMATNSSTPQTEILKKNEISSILSERETEVLSLLSEGLSNKEISESLYLSEGTVRNYISSMLEKLNLRDRTQLAIYYINEHK